MIESPTSANIADFKQRYSGVYGRLDPDGKRTSVYVKGVTATKVVFQDVLGAEYYANVNADVNFEFLPAEKAWYKTSKGMFFMQRIPARQWKRGVCPDNTLIREVTTSGLNLGMVQTSWNAAVFSILDEPQDYKKMVDHYLRDATVQFTPLSRHFAVIVTGVYFFSIPVGTINKDNRTITLLNSMVYQEIVDLCHRNNYPFEVKINA